MGIYKGPYGTTAMISNTDLNIVPRQRLSGVNGSDVILSVNRIVTDSHKERPPVVSHTGISSIVVAEYIGTVL